MDKNKNKNGKKIGTYPKINIPHMVETVASNDHLLIGKILLWPYCNEYYILSGVFKMWFAHVSYNYLLSVTKCGYEENSNLICWGRIVFSTILEKQVTLSDPFLYRSWLLLIWIEWIISRQNYLEKTSYFQFSSGN